MSGDISMAQVVEALRDARFSHLDEDGLQRGITDRLIEAFGPDVRREVRIGARERIDLLIDRLGIEVKVGGSIGAVRRQLARYAASGAIDALLLVSTKVAHRILHGERLADIPVMVVTPQWL